MIEATQLRIGNLIQFDDRSDDIVKVIGLDYEDGRYYVQWERISGKGNFNDGNSWLGEFIPIPITPEWLERLGFEKRESSVCDEWWNGINDVTHDWLVSLTWLHKPELIGAPDYPFFLNGKHVIKSVHALQNLYHALTGTELILKEK